MADAVAIVVPRLNVEERDDIVALRDLSFGIDDSAFDTLFRDFIYPKSSHFLSAYVQLTSDMFSCGRIYNVAAAMVALSAIAPSELYVAQYAKRIPGAVWPVLVGASGTMKSTPIRPVMNIFQQLAGERLILEPQSEQYFIQHFKDYLDQHGGVPMGTLIYTDMGSFFTKTRAGQMMEPLRNRLTDMFDGAPLTKGVLNIDNRFTIFDYRLAVLGAVTPADLEATTTERDWAGGYCARHLWFGAPPRPPREARTRFPIPEGVPILRPLPPLPGGNMAIGPTDTTEEEALQLLVRLVSTLRTKMVVPCGAIRENQHAEQALSTAVKEVRARAEGGPPLLSGYLNRVEEQIIRCALLHAFSSRNDLGNPGWLPNETDIAFGASLVMASMTSVSTLLQHLTWTPFQRNRRNLLVFLKDRPRSFKEILAEVKMPKRALDELILTCESEGRLRLEPTEGGALYVYVPKAEAASLDLVSHAFTKKKKEMKANATKLYGGPVNDADVVAAIAQKLPEITHIATPTAPLVTMQPSQVPVTLIPAVPLAPSMPLAPAVPLPPAMAPVTAGPPAALSALPGSAVSSSRSELPPLSSSLPLPGPAMPQGLPGLPQLPHNPMAAAPPTVRVVHAGPPYGYEE